MKKNSNALLDATELRRRAEEQMKRQQSDTRAQQSMHDMQRLLHELQVHQIELEMQNEELQQSEEVKTYLAQYADLYDFAPVGYLTLDRAGTISQVNLTGAHLLGVDRSQLVNRRFVLFVSEDSRPAFNAFLNQVFTDQTTATCEASLIKEGNSLLWVHLEAKTSDDGEECRAVVVDITERKKMEKEVIESKEKLKQILDSSPDAITVTDLNGIIIECNKAASKIYGSPKAELIGKNAFEFFSPKDHKKAKDNLKKTLELGSIKNVEYTLVTKDGREYPAELSANLIRDAAGNPQSFVAIIRDITERKKIMGEIKKLAKFPSENPNPVLRIKKDGEVIYSNKAGFQILDFWKINIGEVVPERWCSLIRKKFASKNLKEEEEEEEEEEFNDKIFSFIFSPVADEGYVNLYGKDITKRRKAEDLLKESEEKYKNLFEMAPDAVMTLGMDGMITSWNTTAEVLTGYSAVEMIGKSFSEFRAMKTEDAPGYLKMFESLSEGKVPTTFETTMLHKNGKPRSVDVHVGLVTKDGEPNGLLVISRDITERKKAEEMLKNDEEKLRKIFDSSPDGITLADLQGNIIECNQLALEMYGVSIKKELIDKNFFDLIVPEDREKTTKTLEKILEEGKVKSVQCRILKKDGNMYPGELSASIVNDQDDNPKYLLAIIRDISERKKAEASLEEYQRKIERQNIQLKKKDQLKTDFLNITSHELRTPMSAIKGYIQILLKQTFGQINDDQKQALGVVLRNTNRLDNLIQDILDISRLESGTMKFVIEHIEIREMVNEIVETMLPYSKQKEIKINTEIEGNIPELVADKERIKQVIINIVHNAVKFSQNGSIINIRARKEQDTILFEIQDFGRGIPKDQKKKIFEMFYQVDSGADRKFGGAGLGLAISQGIVIASGGKIWAESTVGKGSTFSFNLPLKPVEDVEKRFIEMDLFGLERKRR